jgi:DNA-binding IclR family transcriptional regulator
MSALSRSLDVLRLFNESRSDWTVPDIAQALNVPSSTVYRRVRELVAANFLEPAQEGHYRLGAAFIEFDRLIRLTDPLVRLGAALLRDVAVQARIPCVAVLGRLYGDTVMCVADERSPGASIQTSYERGRPRPLTRGATSKAILAQLRTRRLNKLLSSAEFPDRDRPFSMSEAEFREELAAIRRRGYSITRGEVDRGLVGLAVPVPVPSEALIASLSLVVKATDLDESIERRLVLLLVSSASLLVESLRSDEPKPASEQTRDWNQHSKKAVGAGVHEN